MEVKALQQMLSQFRQVQEKLEKQIDELSVEASAGGGMVTVKMNGQKQLTEVRIEPDVFKSKDQEMLQDLISGRGERSHAPRGRRAFQTGERNLRRPARSGGPENSRPFLNRAVAPG